MNLAQVVTEMNLVAFSLGFEITRKDWRDNVKVPRFFAGEHLSDVTFSFVSKDVPWSWAHVKTKTITPDQAQVLLDRMISAKTSEQLLSILEYYHGKD